MKNFLTIFLFLIGSHLVNGQDIDDLVTIYTIENEIFAGKLISIDQDSVLIENGTVGFLKFSKNDISSMIEGEGGERNFTIASEPYYIASGRPSGKGRHHYKNYYLFGNNFNFGHSDNIDLSIGFETFTLFSGDGGSIPAMQLGIKTAGELSNNVHLGFSAKVMFNDEGGAIFASVPFTFGGLRTNITLSPGIGIDSDGDTIGIGFINANFSITKGVRLVSDFGITNDGTIGTVLLELTFKNGFSILPGIIVGEDISYFPNIAFAIPFGKGWDR